MIVKRILNLSDEEFELLMKCRNVLEDIKKSFENKEFDELSNGAKIFLKLLRKDIEEILNK